jgi:hypothetical protein
MPFSPQIEDSPNASYRELQSHPSFIGCGKFNIFIVLEAGQDKKAGD